MKKHSLLKIMSIIILLVLAITYCIPERGGNSSYLPFGDIVTNYIQSYYYFFDTVIFVLMIGVFYGVLNKTGAYKKLLNKIVEKVKPNSKLFVFATIVVLAVISSLTGITTPLLVFVPFVISIILLLGYDKLIAISSTIVSMILGFIGGMFITFRDPNNYYGYSTTTFEGFAGIDKNANLIPQIILLVLGVVLLIIFINRYMKNVENKKVQYELNSKDELLVNEETEEENNVKTWPLIVMLSILFILIVLGLIPWSDLFEIEIFDKFHKWINGISIKDFAIFQSVISSTFPAFGRWAELGSYMMVIVSMLITTIAIKIVYKIKFNDLINEFAEGAKKMLPTVALIMLAQTILVTTYNHGFIETIIASLSKNGDINFVVASLISMIGSLLHVDVYYTLAGVFAPILNVVKEETMLNVFALSFQSLYGLVAIVGPTSLLLIFALSYLDVPYTTWLKYIWRFVLSLFIVIFALLSIIALI